MLEQEQKHLTLQEELDTLVTLLGPQEARAGFIRLKEALEQGQVNGIEFERCAYGWIAENNASRAYDLKQAVNVAQGIRAIRATPMEMIVALSELGETDRTTREFAVLRTALLPYCN